MVSGRSARREGTVPTLKTGRLTLHADEGREGEDTYKDNKATRTGRREGSSKCSARRPWLRGARPRRRRPGGGLDRWDGYGDGREDRALGGPRQG